MYRWRHKPTWRHRVHIIFNFSRNESTCEANPQNRPLSDSYKGSCPVGSPAGKIPIWRLPQCRRLHYFVRVFVAHKFFFYSSAYAIRVTYVNIMFVLHSQTSGCDVFRCIGGVCYFWHFTPAKQQRPWLPQTLSCISRINLLRFQASRLTLHCPPTRTCQ